jgi:ParB/RepB/Spo0J family partition protein
LSEPQFSKDISKIIGAAYERDIAIDKCHIGEDQARQQGTEVKLDDKIVGAIRATGGVIHPIIVQDNKNDTFEIIVGQRRTGAYHILREEDPKYENIKAKVIEVELTADQKKIISLVENYGRNDMDKVDYASVIEHFYEKYHRVKKYVGIALGINVATVNKYLTEARLPDKVKEAMRGDDGFSIDVAMKALKGMGDDEESADPDALIETARILKKAKPGIRNKAVKKMRDKGMDAETAIQTSSETVSIKLDITGETNERLHEYQEEKKKDSPEDAAISAMETELFRDQKDV